ncbi:STAS domain-containing protein [Kitasatospora sp. NPDC051853]|uniref:STAS domain-containing protein n=1 Tax=Kitasatospora sp. NPDC051853 TaxID=3364058 RepID=UPI0037B77D26
MDASHITPHPDDWSQSAQLTITTDSTAAGVTVVHLAGEIDLDEGAALEDVLTRALVARPSRLVVDMTEVGYCDSAGLNALLKTRTAATAAGVDLLVAGVGDRITRLLWATGTTDVFTITETVEDALAHVRGD